MALAGSLIQAGLSFGPDVACFFVFTGIFTLITWNMRLCVKWYEDFCQRRKSSMLDDKEAEAADAASPSLWIGFIWLPRPTRLCPAWMEKCMGGGEDDHGVSSN